MLTYKITTRKALTTVFLATLNLIACDHNLPLPAQPSAASLVSVNAFEADAYEVQAGDIVKISWDVGGEPSRILILPDLDDISATGSALVRISQTTEFKLQVYVTQNENEILAMTRSFTVDVGSEEQEVEGSENLPEEAEPVEETPPAEEIPSSKETVSAEEPDAGDTTGQSGNPDAVEDETVTDSVSENGATVDVQTITLIVDGFAKQRELGFKPAHIFLSPASGHYWLISEDDKIYFSSDGLQSKPENISAAGLEGAITAVADAENGSVYAGTATGFFYRASDADVFQKIADTGDENSVTAVLPLKQDKTVMVGTARALYRVEAFSEDQSCPDRSGNFCIRYLEDFPQDTFIRYFLGRSGHETVFALTDHGVYQSEDGGNRFDKLDGLSSDVQGGVWNENSLYVWSQDAIWQWDKDRHEFLRVPWDKPENCTFVQDLGSYTFIAANDEVHAVYQNEVFTTNLNASVLFLIGESESAAGLKLGTRNYQIRAFDRDGVVYLLAWSEFQLTAIPNIHFLEELWQP